MGPEQSKRCKMRVCGLGLFSFSSRKIQNLTQNASKGQHLLTKHRPCRQLIGLWLSTSVGHNLERSLGFSGLKTIMYTLYLLHCRNGEKKNLCNLCHLCNHCSSLFWKEKSVVIPFPGMLLSQAFIQLGTLGITSPGVRPIA